MAELYTINNQYEKAFSIYADVRMLIYVFINFKKSYKHVFKGTSGNFLKFTLVYICNFISQLSKPEIFDFIEKHNLHDIVHEKVLIWNYTIY